jgi:hypothetical protein
MEQSILKTVKKILGVADDYTDFDLDIITHINSTFSTLEQLGVGPNGGFSIEDEEATWSDLGLTSNQLHMVKTYIFLKVKIAFDPPSTSFAIEALDKQVQEQEWRLNVNRENALPDTTTTSEEVVL